MVLFLGRVTGGGAGFDVQLLRFPEQHFSVIDLCNAGYGTIEFAGPIADIFLADQFKKDAVVVNKPETTAPDIIAWEKALLDAPAVALPVAQLRLLEGVWVNTEDGFPYASLGFQWRWRVEGDNLIDQFGRRVVPLGGNRFRVLRGEQVFDTAGTGVPDHFRSRVGGSTTTFKRLATLRLPDPQLAEFTGKYVSDELGGATYKLISKDGKLSLEVRNGITVFSNKGLVLAFAQASKSEAAKDVLLMPVSSDVFLTSVDDELIVLRFTRNPQNAVSGFTLTTETVRRLRFNKL